jgi:hypothetical protein
MIVIISMLNHWAQKYLNQMKIILPPLISLKSAETLVKEGIFADFIGDETYKHKGSILLFPAVSNEDVK